MLVNVFILARSVFAELDVEGPLDAGNVDVGLLSDAVLKIVEFVNAGFSFILVSDHSSERKDDIIRGIGSFSEGVHWAIMSHGDLIQPYFR